MVNQICIAGLVQGLAEAIHFGKRAGLDIDKVMEVDFQGGRAVLADGKPLEDHESDGKFDFGFAVDWMRKDLGIVPR